MNTKRLYYTISCALVITLCVAKISEIRINSTMAIKSLTNSTSFDKSVIVAVIDDGINIRHPLIHDNIFTNSLDVPNNKIDDDKNGYIDDYHGWDFVNSDPQVYDDSMYDYHGTGMAGLITADGQNQIRILPIKVYDKNPPNIQSIIDAIKYAEDMGAEIVNISWGSSSREDYLLLNEVINNSNMLFICAAGNEGQNNDLIPDYPSALDLDNIISIACLGQNQTLWTWSNYGENTVDLAVNGVDISCLESDVDNRNKKTIQSGTSVSVALASKKAGLVLQNQRVSAIELKDQLLLKASSSEELSSYIKDGLFLTVSETED